MENHETKQIVLNLTEEQQSILRFALTHSSFFVNKRYDFVYGNDKFYADLLIQVYSACRPTAGYSAHDYEYKPWEVNET